MSPTEEAALRRRGSLRRLAFLTFENTARNLCETRNAKPTHRVTCPRIVDIKDAESDMPRCIFCLKEQERLTNEHVFPAALGGTLELRNAVCDVCNNGFSKFEQPLASELSPIRFILQIPDRRGNVPGVAAMVKTAQKEYEARLKGDGTLQLKPIVTEIKGENGRREFRHQFLTARAREKLEKEAKEKGLELIEEGPGEPEQGEVHFGGDLKFIGSAEGLRTAAKVAYVGLAHSCSTTLATNDCFAEARNYVLEGAGRPVARLFVNAAYMEAVQQGPHQHSLTLAGRHDKKRVDAIVRLFGGLCYFVALSVTYGGADFCMTLVYDAYRGEPNGILLAHPIAEMLQTETT